MKNLIKILMGMLILIGAGFGTATTVKAAMTFGSGVYTNLCDSGTKATYYSCNLGCNSATGVCQSNNNGAVKYVCLGKWDQCLESESGWSSREEIGNPGCGRTVQLSLFDKKCRNDDGSWDQTCNLLGYMVWYGGDCRSNVQPIILPSATPTPVTTSKPLTNPTAKPTIKLIPTPTAISKFVFPTPTVATSGGAISVVAVCGRSCVMVSECQAGFSCVAGKCVNSACPSDASCFCGSGSKLTTTNKLPDTGVDLRVAVLILVGVAGVGLVLRKTAKYVWN
jgi:hypothetical protein